MKNLILPFILAIIAIFSINIADSLNISEITNVRIEDKQQQQLIKGSGNNMSTEIRYLVITNKGTFICESNLIQGKFNNSDIFWHIKKDSTYANMKVSGFGKSFLFDYQNILEIN